MQVVISPAKKLDFKSPTKTTLYSEADFLKRSEQLILILKKKSVSEIANFMKLSDNLAEENVARYKAWQLPFTTENAKQAIFSFVGDVYVGLDAASLSEDDLHFAQQHLRILSGLYGLLKPLDLIQAYRLEMGKSLENKHGSNLYKFWGNDITEALNRGSNTDILVNLASGEYFKAIKPKLLNANIITPIFKDQKQDIYKVIGFFAKKARGLMVRYIIDNRITDAENLKNFNIDGYYFCPSQSTDSDWVFLRDTQI